MSTQWVTAEDLTWPRMILTPAGPAEVFMTGVTSASKAEGESTLALRYTDDSIEVGEYPEELTEDTNWFHIVRVIQEQREPNS